MKLTIQYTIIDFLKAYALSKFGKVAYVLFSFSFCAGILVALISDDPFYGLLIIIIVVVLALMIVIKTRSRFKKSGEYEFGFTEAYIYSKSKNSEGKYKWEIVKSFKYNKNLIVLFLDKNQQIMLFFAKRFFESDKQRQEFIEFIKSKIKK